MAPRLPQPLFDYFPGDGPLLISFPHSGTYVPPELDARLARVLGIAALIAVAGAGAARQLHGRPSVGVFATVELVVLLALVAWGLWRVRREWDRGGRLGAADPDGPHALGHSTDPNRCRRLGDR